MGKGKIQRLESKNYRPRRETRIEKISMKQSDNYTRKEIKAQKLYNKAYNTLGKARGIGGLDPTLFSANKRGRQLDKMGELGAKYNKQVERAQKYHMNLGSKEIPSTTPGHSLAEKAKTTLNGAGKNIKIGKSVGWQDPTIRAAFFDDAQKKQEDVGDVGGEIMNIKTGE